jgi:chorismate dehydratase
MSESIRIGSVPYLNGKPLTRWFQTPEGLSSGIEVIEARPSELAVMLERGELAAALVSSFEALRRPDFAWAPGVSIGGQDEIRTVCAFSQIPYGMVQTVAMDTSSLTSVALLTILLAEVFNRHPQHLAMPPDLPSMLQAADAALLIGDPCMRADRRGLEVLDLGKTWRRHTGLPFVYALWIGRPESITPHLSDALLTAKDYGLTKLDEIADEESKRLDRPFDECYEYVSRIMDYNLDEQLLQGFSTFRDKVFSNNLLGQSRLFDADPSQRILE